MPSGATRWCCVVEDRIKPSQVAGEPVPATLAERVTGARSWKVWRRPRRSSGGGWADASHQVVSTNPATDMTIVPAAQSRIFAKIDLIAAPRPAGRRGKESPRLGR